MSTGLAAELWAGNADLAQPSDAVAQAFFAAHG